MAEATTAQDVEIEPTETQKTAEKLKRELKRQGWTYESVGDEIGITPQAVSEIVNGRTKGATARYALASALGFPPEAFWPDA